MTYEVFPMFMLFIPVKINELNNLKIFLDDNNSSQNYSQCYI